MTLDEAPPALPHGQPDTWIPLGDAAAAVADAAAQAVQSDGRDRPPDVADARLFPVACPLPESD